MSLRQDQETVALLIRHGHTDAVGERLAGRLPGNRLSTVGQAQARALAVRLSTAPLTTVYSSPLERALETAAIVAAPHAIEVARLDSLNEIDFGEWTGCSFADLDRRDDWRRFNTHRSAAPTPGGETALDVQLRVVRALHELRSRHQGGTIALVSHLDVIRTAILHCAGAPLDLFDRFEVAPASITVISLGAYSWRILSTNDDRHVTTTASASN